MIGKLHKREHTGKRKGFPLIVMLVIIAILIFSSVFAIFGPTSPPSKSEQKADFCDNLFTSLNTIDHSITQYMKAGSFSNMKTLTSKEINTIISQNNLAASSAPSPSFSKIFNDYSRSIKSSNGKPDKVALAMGTLAPSSGALRKECPSTFKKIEDKSLKEYYKTHPNGGKPITGP